MKFRVLATFCEAASFEDALKLAGASQQPEFEDVRGDLFLLKHFRAGTFEEVFIFQTPDKEDELTEAEAEEIAQASLACSEQFLYDLDAPGDVSALLMREP